MADLKTYRAEFEGRKAGAIGLPDRIKMTVQGVDPTHARGQLYDLHGYDHIHHLTLTEVLPPDVRVENHGTIFTFELVTEPARAWVAEHVPDDAQWLGGRLCVEHRYARDLAAGMQGDGLVVV